jgi:hypothetical protein
MPTVQFDPATLALWTTTGALPEDAAQLAASAMEAAARGENPQGVVTGTAEAGSHCG